LAAKLRLTDSQVSEAEGTTLPAPAPLRVLHIISDLSIGGAEMMLYKLLAASDRQRVAPVVVTLVNRGDLLQRIKNLGIDVYTIGLKPGRPSPLGLWRLVRLMRQLRPQLILGWMYHSCLAAQLAKPFLREPAKVLWSIHCSSNCWRGEKKLTAAVVKVCALLSRLPDHVIFVSHASQREHEATGYPKKLSSVIPNGINVLEFTRCSESPLSVREELGLPPDAMLLGIAGRYHKMKDHENFLRAAALLSKTHPKVQFLLVGRDVDDRNENLTRIINELGLRNQTHLLGERSDMPRLVAALDVFSLSSSHGESFPNVIGEAMACEVPCVVTDVGDAAQIVGDAGRVVEPRNPAALAAAWRELFELGAANRKALGWEARSRVIERFAMDSVSTRYQVLFESLLANDATDDFGLSTSAAAFNEVV
jgi:glycosyltransferase involved in cell wall biosynthesis